MPDPKLLPRDHVLVPTVSVRPYGVGERVYDVILLWDYEHSFAEMSCHHSHITREAAERCGGEVLLRLRKGEVPW